MNLTVKTLFAVLAFGGSALIAAAQTPRIMVVDMAQLYDNHYKTEEQNAKLRGDEQKAQEELERLNARGNQLVEQYRELVEQSRNAALADSARERLEQDAQAKLEEIQRMQNEVQSFQVNTQRTLQQRIRTFRDIMLEEIGKIATDVAKQKGATLLLDKSGPSLIGIAAVVYSDPSLDITEAVTAEINKTRPAGTPAATTAPSGSTSPNRAVPTAADEPAVSFPGTKKK
jgi:outer membrane protein